MSLKHILIKSLYHHLLSCDFIKMAVEKNLERRKQNCCVPLQAPTHGWEHPNSLLGNEVEADHTEPAQLSVWRRVLHPPRPRHDLTKKQPVQVWEQLRNSGREILFHLTDTRKQKETFT